MSRSRWTCSTLALLLIAVPGLRAGGTASGEASAKEVDKRTFKQGEVTVVVTATKEPIETANTEVTAEQIQDFDRDTASSALNLLPGLSVTHNTRNEDMIYVRGNDSRQVPVFVDGIPAYVPYDGSMDYSRFTTFDLSTIQVAKGFSSVAYGANTLGGAINLVSRRPSEAFEGDVRAGAFDEDGRTVAVNVGTNQGRWYLQAGGSYTSADGWRMSSDFDPNVREDGGRRDNAQFSDKKLSLKFGFTPNDQDEYVIGIVRQRGEKGNPVSTDPASKPLRYWRWPYWDKDSSFLTTHTALGDKGYLKLRAYYDTYRNSIFDYTDSTYSQINATGMFSPTGKSRYDDFTQGWMAEAVTTLLSNHSLKGVIQTKKDVHREDDYTRSSTDLWPHYEDRYLSLGLEDSITISPSLDLSLGLAWDKQKPVDSGPTWSLPDSRKYLHGQAGLFWRMSPTVRLYGTIAQKDHFPTLKDRYSLRFKTFIENPDLKPERSTNYELGLKADPTEQLQLEAALFLSDIRDLIQEVKNVQGTKSQMRNIGKVRNSGVELSVGWKPSPHFQTGLGYTYLDRSNRSDPSTKLTGTPKNRVTGYVRVAPRESLYLLASLQCQDALWDSNTVQLGGFTTVDVTLGWQVTSSLLLDGGLTNALDRDYQLTTGYPLAGRTWFANARYRF